LQLPLLYGSIDLEPNITGQDINGVIISDNQFKQGPVVAQTDINSTFWFDEPFSVTGAIIQCGVQSTGHQGARTRGAVVVNNTFENGIISSYAYFPWNQISNNTFKIGTITMAADEDVNALSGTVVSGNTAESAGGGTGFILVSGQIANCSFVNNTVLDGNPCVHIFPQHKYARFDQINTFIGNFPLVSGDINSQSIVIKADTISKTGK
jgi:hypothetical protein